MLACLAFGCAIVTWFAQPVRTPGPARETLQAIGGTGSGTVLIQGSFGHEWQYESRDEIRRYRPELVRLAKAIICLNACEPMFNTTGWKRVPDAPVETWMRK